MEEEVIKTIELAGVISTQRSQNDLITKVKEELPKFFGFESAAILLRDVKSGFIFTLNELTRDDAKEALRDKFKEQQDLKLRLKYNYEDTIKQLSEKEQEELEQ